MREFTVKKGVRGYIVQIGCQIAGFSTKEDLRDAITEYISDPEGTEKKYYKPSEGVPVGIQELRSDTCTNQQSAGLGVSKQEMPRRR